MIELLGAVFVLESVFFLLVRGPGRSAGGHLTRGPNQRECGIAEQRQG